MSAIRALALYVWLGYFLGRRQYLKFTNRPVATCEVTVWTLAEEEEIFNLINFGGVAQGQSDIGGV